MHISIGQLQTATQKLSTVHPFFGMTFLAMKKANLPIGETAIINFAQANRDLLEAYYRPLPDASQYYSPFQTAGDGWVSIEHPRTTLQRIAKNTFGDAFIHRSKTNYWGWKNNYLDVLKEKLNERPEHRTIPAFALATWLYRDVEFSQRTAPKQLITRLFDEFHISREEQTLFDIDQAAEEFWLAEFKYTLSDLLDLLGRPTDAPPETGASLRSLEIQEVGPADDFHYEPKSRVNVITGDNSLGKTFLLDCAWYALTGDWDACPLQPRRLGDAKGGRVRYSLATSTGSTGDFTARFDWPTQQWRSPRQPAAYPGLVIYGRHDGSFSVWDSAKGRSGSSRLPPKILLRQQEIWDGLQTDRSVLCNGLIRDVVSWQMAPSRYHAQYSALVKALEKLSPSAEHPLELAEPVRIPPDTREIPTIRMPYGPVPIIHASAGVQRIVALAYVLVWAWREHVEYSQAAQKEPQRRIVVLVDEIEAHLHPRWQRAIVPALMSAIGELETQVSPQVHLATHSPLVLASLEPIFDDAQDSLYCLELEGKDVHLEEVPFVARGRADYWLMSSVFGLGQARSLPAEAAIAEAKRLQEVDSDNHDDVARVHHELTKTLAQDDDFWPRWLFWAEQRGVR